MKTISYLIVCLLIAVAIPLNDEGKVISFNDLPDAAQSFIVNYFPNEKISTITEEMDDRQKEYKVIFAADQSIEFDKDGNWYKIDFRNGIPQAVLSEKMLSQIIARYPAVKITEIEKEIGKTSVKLANGIELYFDKQHNLIKDK